MDDDGVYQQLRIGVVEGRYRPGERLVEQVLADDLGVSRTPVREALRRLDADGLIVTERNRGAAVRTYDRSDVEDLYELRGRLESYACELAAARRTDEDLTGLRAAADGFAAHAHSSGRERVQGLNATNRAFHDGVVAAARHAKLASMLRGTVDVPLVFQALESFDGEELRRSAMFHHLVVDAIARQDPQRAGRLMSEHIAQGLDMVRHLVDETAD